MRAGRSTRPKLLFWGQIGNVTLVKFSNLEAPTARRRQGIPNTQSATVCLCFRCLGQAARGLHCDASVNMAAFLPDHVEFNGSLSLHFNGNRALISLTARCCGISMGIRCIYYRPTSISMGSAVRICVQPVGVWKCNAQVLNSWRRTRCNSTAPRRCKCSPGDRHSKSKALPGCIYRGGAAQNKMLGGIDCISTGSRCTGIARTPRARCASGASSLRPCDSQVCRAGRVVHVCGRGKGVVAGAPPRRARGQAILTATTNGGKPLATATTDGNSCIGTHFAE